MTYQPTPIDTAAVHLTDDLLELTERLAENAHDVWAWHRIAEGWVSGPSRDDANKRHPCLVPYAQLPDSEKEYDRKMAIETLKVIVKLGFRICLTP